MTKAKMDICLVPEIGSGYPSRACLGIPYPRLAFGMF